MKVLALAVVLLVGCGPTIGDPCTSAQDCLGKTCLNGGGFPGGYCTQSCKLDDPNTCPAGSICIADGISKNLNGCFRSCTSTRECRATYRCAPFHGTDSACIGP